LKEFQKLWKKKASSKDPVNAKSVDNSNPIPRVGRGKNKKYDESITTSTNSGQTITISAHGSKEEKEIPAAYDYYSVDVNDHNYKYYQ
jgi:hypothetical protein